MRELEHPSLIARPRSSPALKAFIEARKRQMFLEQAYKPGCAFCGVQGPEMMAESAVRWSARHRDECSARVAA